MNFAKKLAALVLVAAAGAWAYYANVASGRQSMDMNMRVTSGNTPFPVTLASVERGTITGSVTYTGSVLAFNEEDVFPRVTGRIVEVPVRYRERIYGVTKIRRWRHGWLLLRMCGIAVRKLKFA